MDNSARVSGQRETPRRRPPPQRPKASFALQSPDPTRFQFRSSGYRWAGASEDPRARDRDVNERQQRWRVGTFFLRTVFAKASHQAQQENERSRQTLPATDA